MFELDRKLVEASLRDRNDPLVRLRRRAVVAVGAAAELQALGVMIAAQRPDCTGVSFLATQALMGTIFLLLSFQMPQMALVSAAMVQVVTWIGWMVTKDRVAVPGWFFQALAFLALLAGIVGVFGRRKNAGN